MNQSEFLINLDYTLILDGSMKTLASKETFKESGISANSDLYLFLLANNAVIKKPQTLNKEEVYPESSSISEEKKISEKEEAEVGENSVDEV